MSAVTSSVNKLSIAMALGAFASLGLLSGWFIGASASPIAGTVVTSTFTLSGLVLTAAIGLKQAKDKAIGNLQTVAPLVLFIGAAVILLSFTCFVGVQLGVRSNHNNYPGFETILADSGIENSKLTVADRWRTHLIYWELQSQGRPSDVIREFLMGTVSPILQVPDDDRRLQEASLDDLLSKLQDVSPQKSIIAEENSGGFWPGA